MIENLAQLKRNAKDYVWTMIQHDWCNGLPKIHSILNVPRRVQTMQTNGMQFEPLPGKESGSWLYFSDGAKGFEFINDEVHVDLTGQGTFAEKMVYRLEPIGVLQVA